MHGYKPSSKVFYRMVFYAVTNLDNYIVNVAAFAVISQGYSN